MPKMHKNTSGGRAPPTLAGGAYAHTIRTREMLLRDCSERTCIVVSLYRFLCLFVVVLVALF